MVDIEKGWISTRDAAERLSVPIELVRIWMRTGRRAADGEFVKLKSAWAGENRITRPEWIEAFLAATVASE